MKKEYIMPAIELVHLQTVAIMAGSGDMNINQEEVNDVEDLLSRQRSHSIWDDDEE